MSSPSARSAHAGTISPRTATNGRKRSERRRSSSLARLVGAVGMLLVTIVLFWLLTDDAFRVRAANVTISGVHWSDESAIRARLLGIDRLPNTFRVRTSDLVSDIRTLPAISSVSAVVTLPASVTVHVTERQPIFTWSDGKEAWLVDAGGMLFAPAPHEEGAAAPADVGVPADVVSPQPSPETIEDEVRSDMGRVGLPVVEDERLLEKPFTVGARLPAIDLAVMEQLLAVTPELLGSDAASLSLSVDQSDGYVLRSDTGWQAVFGHYSPTVQPPDVVPRQVQCLTWLLANRERRLLRVWLSPSAETCGTFTRTGGRG